MVDSWNKLSGFGSAPLANEMVNEIKDCNGIGVKITVIVRRIFGENVLYIMDHGGMIDAVHATSIREKPISLTGVRLVSSNGEPCPQGKIAV